MDQANAGSSEPSSSQEASALPLCFPHDADAPGLVLQEGDPRLARMRELVSRCRSFPYDVHRLRQVEAEIHLVDSISRADGLAIDVGANVGYFSDAMARKNARVLAFEANSRLIPVLTLNMMQHENVVIVPLAVGSRCETTQFHVPMVGDGDFLTFSGYGGLRNPSFGQGALPTVQQVVQVIPLDSLGLENVSLLKVDVEGTELDVLVGATQTIQKSRPNILIENERRHTARAADVFRHLALLDYAGFFYDRSEQSLKSLDAFSFDTHQKVDERGMIVDQQNYVNNFLFLPRERIRPD